MLEMVAITLDGALAGVAIGAGKESHFGTAHGGVGAVAVSTLLVDRLEIGSPHRVDFQRETAQAPEDPVERCLVDIICGEPCVIRPNLRAEVGEGMLHLRSEPASHVDLVIRSHRSNPLSSRPSLPRSCRASSDATSNASADSVPCGRTNTIARSGESRNHPTG